jgi:hypothetical protein
MKLAAILFLTLLISFCLAQITIAAPVSAAGRRRKLGKILYKPKREAAFGWGSGSQWGHQSGGSWGGHGGWGSHHSQSFGSQQSYGFSF